MGANNIIDLTVSIAITLLFLGFFMFFLSPIALDQFGGFEDEQEKTAKKVSTEIIPTDDNFTYEETMLCLSSCDEYTPAPKKFSIDINSSKAFIITVDNYYFDNKDVIMQNTMRLLKVNKDKEFIIEPSVSEEGINNWDIKVK